MRPGGGRERLTSEAIPEAIPPHSAGQVRHNGTSIRARRLQDLESDMGYDTRRRVLEGVL